MFVFSDRIPKIDSSYTHFGLVFMFVLGYFPTKVQAQSIQVLDDYSHVSEDVSVKIPILRNDVARIDQFDTASIVIDQSVPPSAGSILNIDRHGMITYLPNPDFFGRDSFLYQVCTVSDQCASAMVFVTVHAVNDPPENLHDKVNIFEDHVIKFDPLSNDLDPDGLSAHHSIKLVSMANAGTAEIMQDQMQIQYRPDPNYYGRDFFYYAYCDEYTCDTAMVRLRIDPVNDKPSIRPDTAMTYQNILAVIDPKINDDDSLDGTELNIASLSILAHPNHGEAHLDTSLGMFIYVPQDNYQGRDIITYRICDIGPDPIYCDTAVIVIDVEPPPSATSISSQSLGVLQENPIKAGQSINRSSPNMLRDQ